MVVPGFLELEYACGNRYACSLTPDIDDLDADGDTEELVITTTSLHAHIGADGPRGHHHMMGGM